MDIDISKADLIQGWMTPKELQWLARMALKSHLIIEVGAWKGRSTMALAVHTPGVVFSVDHWKGSVTDNGVICTELAKLGGPDALLSAFKENLTVEIGAGKVVPIVADSDIAVELLAKRLGDQKVDLVFIDGDHAYESVRRDITNYQALLRIGGTMAGHDFSSEWPGVIQAVHELFPSFNTVPETALWYASRSAS